MGDTWHVGRCLVHMVITETVPARRKRKVTHRINHLSLEFKPKRYKSKYHQF